MRLDGLTSLRFFAALLVVLLHTGDNLTPFPGARDVFGLGYLGVTFFFVLSGFVLTWTYHEGDSARHFYGRRFARVWPLHAVTTVIAGAALGATSVVALPFVLTLTQAFVPSGAVYYAWNAPSWSLSCEAFFYLMFPVVIARAWNARSPLRWGAGTFGFVAAITGLVYVLAAPVSQALGFSRNGLIGYVLNTFPPYRFGEFCFGVCLGVAARRGVRVPVSQTVALAGTTALLVGMTTVAAYFGRVESLPAGVASLVTMPAVGLCILAVALADVDDRPSLLRSPLLVRLGQASFALYLVHFTLIRVVATHGHGTPRWLLALAALVLSIAVADVAHRWLEQPVERRLRTRLGARRARVEESIPSGLTS